MAQSYQVDIVTKVQGASAVTKLEKSLQNLNTQQNKVDTAARKAAGGTRQLGNAAQSAGNSAKASAAGFKTMGTAIAAATAKLTLIIGAFQGVGKAFSAAFERQNAEKRLQNLTGSAGEYQAALAAASSASQKFGMTQTEATQALGDVYSRLSGVGYGLKEVTTIYQGFNTVAMQSGVSSEAASAAFLQLGQAMGSGVLQGDELRSILEQMPQLTQLIATQMGVSTSAIKQLGAEGKITSDIVYSALEKASLGAGNLTTNLTPAQQAMNDWKKATENLSVAFGQVLLPILVKFVNFLTPMIEGVGLLVTKLNELGVTKVFEFLLEPARIFGELVRGATENTNQLNEATNGAAGTAEQLVSQYSSLPETMGAAAVASEPLAQNTERVALATAQMGAPLQQLPLQMQTAALSAGELATSQEQIRAAAEGNSAAIAAQAEQMNEIVGATDERLNAEESIGQATEVNAAANEAMTGISAMQIKHKQVMLKLEYLHAKVRAAYAKAAVKLMEMEVKHNRDLALATEKRVQAEVALQRSKGIFNKYQDIALKAAADYVMLSEKAVANNKAMGQEVNQLFNEYVEVARVAAGISQEVDTQAFGQANLNQMANGTANEIQRQAQNMETTNGKIQAGAAGMANLANEAERAASAMASIGGGTGVQGSTSTKQYATYKKYKVEKNGDIRLTTDEERRKDLNQKRVNMMNQKSAFEQAFSQSTAGTDWELKFQNAMKYGGNIAPWQVDRALRESHLGLQQKQMMDRGAPSYNAYAEGGYVSEPTNALIGEGGEPEYVIPESKLSGAFRNYSRGMRGDQMIPNGNVTNTINYSGSVVSMGGSEYIAKSDVPGLLNQATSHTLNTLQRSSRARLNTGLR